MNPPIQSAERVICYVDGFNLYFGVCEAGLMSYKWIDLLTLASKLLQPHQKLIETLFFTSRIRNNPAKEQRQSNYIQALEVTGVKAVFGHYQDGVAECRRCGNRWSSPSEKMTDVNIATRMITDAFENKYDVALLVSGDSDLVPPLEAVKKFFPNKRVVVAFPPKRHSVRLQAAASYSFTIGQAKIRQSQLPDSVTKPDGFVLRRPPEWV